MLKKGDLVEVTNYWTAIAGELGIIVDTPSTSFYAGFLELSLYLVYVPNREEFVRVFRRDMVFLFRGH